MSDVMVRALAKEAGLRGIACLTTGLAREVAERHAAYPVAAAALGYGLTAGALLGGLLKVQERLALKVDGNGRLRKLVVEADAYGRVRGYVAVPDAPSPPEITRAAVAEAIGNQGELTVVKDLRLKDLYRSVVALQSGELDKELTHYLNASEQVPSLAQIGVRMDSGTLAVVGGLLVQVMPGHEPDVLARLAAELAAQPPLEERLAADTTPEALLAQLFAGMPYEVLETRPLMFRCSCSRERSRQALAMLDYDDILALLIEGHATVDCHFCYARYEFNRDELEDILHEVEAAGGGPDDEEQ